MSEFVNKRYVVTGAASGIGHAVAEKLLASGADDHTVRLWDVASERQTATIARHPVRVEGYQCSVTFSPDGRALATAVSVGANSQVER